MQARIPNPCNKSHCRCVITHSYAVTHFKGCALKDDSSVAFKLCPAAFVVPSSFDQSTILTIIRILSYDDHGDDDDGKQLMMPRMLPEMRMKQHRQPIVKHTEQCSERSRLTQKRMTCVLGARFPFPWALLGLADGASSEARAPETANHVNHKTIPCESQDEHVNRRTSM